MARRSLVLACAAMLLALGASSARAQYPPRPGADAGVEHIITSDPWALRAPNSSRVGVDNHGGRAAMVIVSFSAMHEGGGFVEIASPVRAIAVAAGASAEAVFAGTPLRSGGYLLRACASAVLDAHPSDDCKVADIGAGPSVGRAHTKVSKGFRATRADVRRLRAARVPRSARP